MGTGDPVKLGHPPGSFMFGHPDDIFCYRPAHNISGKNTVLLWPETDQVAGYWPWGDDNMHSSVSSVLGEMEWSDMVRSALSHDIDAPPRNRQICRRFKQVGPFRPLFCAGLGSHASCFCDPSFEKAERAWTKQKNGNGQSPSSFWIFCMAFPFSTGPWRGHYPFRSGYGDICSGFRLDAATVHRSRRCISSFFPGSTSE